MGKRISQKFRDTKNVSLCAENLMKYYKQRHRLNGRNPDNFAVNPVYNLLNIFKLKYFYSFLFYEKGKR